MNFINGIRTPRVFVFSLLLWLFPAAALFAHGDKIVPQLVNGEQGDGTGFRTKIVITNLGPYQSEQISNLKIQFFNEDGTFWSIATVAHGQNGELNLYNIGAHETIRIETDGEGPLKQGYAIIRNLEPTTIYEEDYQVAITVFYEVLKNGNVIDTVSVPLGEPTLTWLFPFEMDVTNELLAGLAIVNLSEETNKVTLALFPDNPSIDQNGQAQFDRSTEFILEGKEHRASFLHQQDWFTEASASGNMASNGTLLQGMVRGWSDYPVAILGLLQTPTPTGVQYATLVPAYFDSLRTNTFMYMREGFPLDADIPVSDYYEGEQVPLSITIPWDLFYQTVDATSRQFIAQNGAMFASIGILNNTEEFRDLSLADIQGLDYSENSIDLSNDSDNLEVGYTFAIKTGLGRYVKIFISAVIQDGTYRDLALMMHVYK